jgi:FkbM family methyltransferase
MSLKSSLIYCSSIFKKALAWPLRFIPATLEVPIMSGLLKGHRWILGAGNHSHWLGIYEYKKQKLFIRTIKINSVVYDIGGHAGFYAMLSSVLVGSNGQVYVFEPLPRNLALLRNHIKLNKMTNIKVMACAVSENGGPNLFKEWDNSYMGRLSSSGNIKVKTVSIDELYKNTKSSRLII